MRDNDDDLNPYSSPKSVADLPTEYSFEGTVNLKDFTALLPGPLLVFLTRLAVLVSGMGLCIAVPGLVLGLVTQDYEASAACGTLSVLLGVMFFLCGFVLSPHRRARRAVARHPDLLGPARGDLSKQGLVLDDGKNIHWFGPAYLRRMVVSKYGVRLPIGQDPYRFVALPNRNFSSFNVKGIRKLAADAALDISDATCNWEKMESDVSQSLGNCPEDAYVFRSIRTVPNPFVKQFRTNSITSIVVLISLGIVTMIFDQDGLRGFKWIAPFLALILVYDIFRTWRRLFSTNEFQTWHWGWICENRILLAHYDWAAVCPLSSFTMLDESDGCIQLQGITGDVSRIERDFLVNQERWPTLVATVKCHAKQQSQPEIPKL